MEAKRQRTEEETSPTNEGLKSAGSTSSSNDGKLNKKYIPPSILGSRPFPDVTLQIADFLKKAINDAQTMKLKYEAKGRKCSVEIEAKLGRIVEKDSGKRIHLPIKSEAVIVDPAYYFSFKSDTTLQQHAALNRRLNTQTSRSTNGPSAVHYQHKREEDKFYEIRGIGSVRRTVDQQTRQTKCILTKVPIGHMEVFLPSWPLDYRISVNLEAHLDEQQANEVKTDVYNCTHSRAKDRLSYVMHPFQVDLTQVKLYDGGDKPKSAESTVTHEVEVEFTQVDVLIAEMNKDNRKEPNVYLDFVDAFVNNPRALIRKVAEIQ